MKKGISLIVMLITIVVIIILAASIVNTVIYNNPIENSKEATFRSDLQEIKNAYGIRQGDLMTKYKGDKSKITEEDYEGVVFEQYKNEVLAFGEGLIYLGEDKKKQEIAESMDYIVGNPNDSVLKARVDGDTFYAAEYIKKITKVKFIAINKVPNEVVEYWDVSEGNNGAVMAWVVNDGNGGYELTIGGLGKVIANKNSDNMFNGFSAVKEIDIKVLDTSMTTNMARMFCGCNSLISIDLSRFNTSQVTTMYCMFAECHNLKNLNVNNFNTSKLSNMGYMFAGCRSITNLDVSNFDTSNVSVMEQTFDSCINLVSIDVSNFDTSKVRDMHGMFARCSKLISIGGINLNRSQGARLASMFVNCSRLKVTISVNSVNYIPYDNMFTNAATEEGSEIIVNYTQETSDLVDKMIETKSDNSNVKKGVEVSI